MSTITHPLNDDSWRQFRIGIEELRLILNRQGADLEAADDRHRHHFLSLPQARRAQILAHLRREIEVYLAAEHENVQINDSLRHLKFALRYLGMGVDPAFFEMVKSDEVIELYSTEHIQLFRSFNFFSLCNYNLDDLMIHEWFHLYERDETVTQSLLAQILLHLKGTSSLTPIRLDSHLMQEKFSKPRGRFQMRFGHLASAFAGPQKRVGYVVNISSQPLGN